MPDAAVPAPPADDEPDLDALTVGDIVMLQYKEEHGHPVVLPRSGSLLDQLGDALQEIERLRAGAPPQPEITHEQIRQILIKGIGRGWLRSPGGAIERTADELLALLADGATPAGPEVKRG